MVEDGSSGLERAGARRAPNTRTLVEYAAGRLREDILSGELSAGERILLDGVAQELGISAIPLREALRMLASEGLVTPLAHRGYTVAPVTVDDLEETYRIRLMLEPLAVRLAVPRLAKADFRYLANELDLLGRAFRDGDWPEHRLHHRAFHFGIYEKCDSKWLLRFTDMLWANSERYQRMTVEIQGELSQRANEHRRILSACRSGDAETASHLMHDHLSRAAETLRSYLIGNGHIEADRAG